jgi:MFS family permease
MDRMVNVALPSIQSELGFGPAAVTWVVNAYVLAFTGLLLLSGRAADLFGRRRVFVVGASLFTVGTLLAAVALTKELLILGRVVQGIGGRRPESGGHVPVARHLPGGTTRPGDGGVGCCVDAGWSHRRRERGSARRHRGLAGRVPGDRSGVPGRHCPGPASAGG